MVQPLMEFLRKLKIELPYDPAIALLGIYPKDTNVVTQKGTCIPMYIAAMSTMAKLWKEPRCPSTDEWKKKWYIYVCRYVCVYTYIHSMYICVCTYTHTHMCIYIHA